MRLRISLLIATVASSSAYAEELASLETILQGSPEESYKYVRCAAFYRANLNWMGETSIPKAASEEIYAAMTALLIVGTMIRSTKTGEDFNSVLPTVQSDAAVIIKLYAENYRQRYAVRGAAWDGNPLWQSDAESCKLIGEAAIQGTAELLLLEENQP